LYDSGIDPDIEERRFPMSVVTVSPKFQVVIPLAVRKSLGIRAGEKVCVMEYDGRIALIPIKPMRKMRGAFKGMDTTLDRDADR
jgi:AbrB family looped-hinge helix DNA binding protein